MCKDRQDKVNPKPLKDLTEENIYIILYLFRFLYLKSILDKSQWTILTAWISNNIPVAHTDFLQATLQFHLL